MDTCLIDSPIYICIKNSVECQLPMQEEQEVECIDRTETSNQVTPSRALTPLPFSVYYLGTCRPAGVASQPIQAVQRIRRNNSYRIFGYHLLGDDDQSRSNIPTLSSVAPSPSPFFSSLATLYFFSVARLSQARLPLWRHCCGYPFGSGTACPVIWWMMMGTCCLSLGLTWLYSRFVICLKCKRYLPVSQGWIFPG